MSATSVGVAPSGECLRSNGGYGSYGWQVKLCDPFAIRPYLSALEMRFMTKRYTNRRSILLLLLNSLSYISGVSSGQSFIPPTATSWLPTPEFFGQKLALQICPLFFGYALDKFMLNPWHKGCMEKPRLGVWWSVVRSPVAGSGAKFEPLTRSSAPGPL